MKLSEKWLREWVDPPIGLEGLVNQLTMAGLEVESLTPAAPVLTHVVVGRVVQCQPHPERERLSLCQVDIGSEWLTILCGAPDVKQGILVPVALPGAKLPGGQMISPVTIAGVESFGMLCSRAELGLSDQSEDLMKLPDAFLPGTPLSEVLQLEDTILEIKTTPNRGDCLSVLGISREVGVLNRLALHLPDFQEVVAHSSETFPVEVSQPALCPRYVGRVIRGIRSHVSSPWWLQEKLRRAGMRSHHPCVDVTNYILLELGQPMHAFDLGQLKSSMEVRLARESEQLILLDGKALTLTPETLVIADAERVLALAGIMGGMNSGIQEETTDIFLESAFFPPSAIMGKPRYYGIQTDSSYRFERGVDPEGQRRAIERATALLLSIVGGEPGPVVEVVSPDGLPKPTTIFLRDKQIERVLGTAIPKVITEEILTRLGMGLKPTDQGIEITPPSHRFDINAEIDIIEELARLYGYEKLPSLPSPTIIKTEESWQSPSTVTQCLRYALVERGYQEVITYSFIDPQHHQMTLPDQNSLSLANPLSAELSVMRTSLWPGLLRTMIHNRRRQRARVRIFETGMVFIPGDHGLEQKVVIGGAITGSRYPEQWGEPKRNSDFFSLKGDVEALLAAIGERTDYHFISATCSTLHPGQSAQIFYKNFPIGWIGTLHPEIQTAWDFSEPVYLFEMALASLILRDSLRYKGFSPYPAIRRDIALVVPEAIHSDTLEKIIREIGGDQLKSLILFDIYKGVGVQSGHRSMAFGLVLQDDYQTLTEPVADQLLERIIQQLHNAVGATLRG